MDPEKHMEGFARQDHASLFTDTDGENNAQYPWKAYGYKQILGGRKFNELERYRHKGMPLARVNMCNPLVYCGNAMLLNGPLSEDALHDVLALKDLQDKPCLQLFVFSGRKAPIRHAHQDAGASRRAQTAHLTTRCHLGESSPRPSGLH